MNFSVENIKNTPAFVVDEDLLINNLKVLEKLREETGVKILLALKAFAMHSLASRLMQYLDGVCASGLNESSLGAEYFKKEVHVYSPGFKSSEVSKLTQTSDHVIFNSLTQFRKLHPEFLAEAKKLGKKLEFGLRVNPGYSEVEVALYNPCVTGSRFGVLVEELSSLSADEWTKLSGLHFHTMCEQGADVLQRTVAKIEEKASQYLSKCKFINLGGGHHITKPGYDLALLGSIVTHLKERYQCQIYLEPGEAIALNTGYLVASVVDIVYNGMNIAVLDTSATAHMPDVIEMPYRPKVYDADLPDILPHTYRLSGSTCLAGDVIGDYSFKHPLEVGDKLVFDDMGTTLW
ncbi:MAG: carboxynorspermidine decarboxylase [Bdellovibrionota bacterium]